MRHKAREFMTLTQGSRSVQEYSQAFNQLATYAPEQVDTDEKRKDCFMKGLNAELQDRLNLNMSGTFAEFVNNAIIVEDGYRRVQSERKRSANTMGSTSAPPQKYRMVYTNAAGQRYRSPPMTAPFPHPQQQRPTFGQRPPAPRPPQSSTSNVGNHPPPSSPQ